MLGRTNSSGWYTLIALASLVLPPTLLGQSLGDVAKKEKERRARAGQTTVIDDGTLEKQRAKAEGRSAPAPSSSPVASPSAVSRVAPPISDDTPESKESYWRGRAARAREEIVAAEKALARAEIEAAQALNAKLQASPDPGCMLTGLETYAEMKEKCKRSANDAWGLHAKALENLEAAKKRNEAAQRAMVDLEDQARRAGALPGWLR